MNERIRHHLNLNEKDVDTTELIQRLATARLGSNGKEDKTTNNGANLLGIVDNPSQSTTALLNKDIRSIFRDNNVSESTMMIRGNVPKTPERRPISGSSLDLATGFDDDEEEDYDEYVSDHHLHKHHTFEIDIDHFNYLLAKLPVSVKTTHFKHILSNYTDSLKKHKMNISADRFIITIFNQLSQPDFNLIRSPKMVEIIDIFVNRPCNEAMKLSNFLYFSQVHNTKLRYFKLWLIKFRKLKELKKSELVWNKYLMKKHLARWMLNFDIYQNELPSNAKIFSDVKKVLKFYDVWKMKLNKVEKLNEVVQYQQESKYFYKWTGKINKDRENADDFYEENLLTKFWQQWQLKARSHDSVLDEYRLKVVVGKWKLKYERIKEMESESKLLELVLHGGYFFVKWNRDTITQRNKKAVLDQRLRALTLKKLVDIWQGALSIKRTEKQAAIVRDQIMLEYFFKAWVRRKSNALQVKEMRYNQAQRLKKIVFNSWQRELAINFQVSKLSRETTLKKFFKLWKLKTIQEVYGHDNRFDTALVAKTLAVWCKKARTRQQCKVHKTMILQKFLKTWREKYQENLNLIDVSGEANSAFLKFRYLKRWRRRQKFNQTELQQRLLFFQKKVAFNRWTDKTEKVAKMKKRASEFYQNKSSALVKLRFLKQWCTHYELAKETRLGNMLEIKKLEKDMELERDYLARWKKRTDVYNSMLLVYNDQVSKKAILPNFLAMWQSKFNYIKAMEKQANDINDLNLLSSGFNKIQLRLAHIHEINQLHDIYNQDRELKLIMKYLNFWSLKLLKQKRDKENIKSFRDRWDRAHLRAILLLWKGKQQHSSQNSTTYEEIDYSPTVLRSNPLLGGQHLTPKKSILDPTFNASASSIPGSERIKRQRYEALRTRYSQVKYAIPSPLKFDHSKPLKQTPVLSTSKNTTILSRQSHTWSDSKKLKFVERRDPISMDGSDKTTSEFITPALARNIKLPTPYAEEHNSVSEDFDDPISSPIISHRNLFKYGSSQKKRITSKESSVYGDSTAGLF